MTRLIDTSILNKPKIPRRQITRSVDEYTIKAKLAGDNRSLARKTYEEVYEKVIYIIITYKHVLAVLALAGLVWVVWLVKKLATPPTPTIIEQPTNSLF